MTKITYILPDGTEHDVDVANGRSVMEGAVRQNLGGIVAECGGSCSCATCHVFLDDEYQDRFDQATKDEQDLLEFLDDVQPNSRLSCQLIVSDAACNARVRVADSNGQ